MKSLALPIFVSNECDGDREDFVTFYYKENMTKDVEQYNTSYKKC